MRSTQLVLVLATGTTMVSGSAFAKRKYGMAGCGLGSVVFGSGGMQVSAATTNGSSSNQYFGISAGTLNCKPDKVAAAIVEQEEFLAANLKTLQKEISQGGGQTVTAFAEVLGCSGPARNTAEKVLVSAHDAMFAQPGIENIRDQATKELQAHEATASGCGNLVL
jgi:hypothetical protein